MHMYMLNITHTHTCALELLLAKIWTGADRAARLNFFVE